MLLVLFISFACCLNVEKKKKLNSSDLFKGKVILFFFFLFLKNEMILVSKLRKNSCLNIKRFLFFCLVAGKKEKGKKRGGPAFLFWLVGR